MTGVSQEKGFRMPDGLDRRFYRRGASPDAHQLRRIRMIRRLAGGCSGRALDYGCGYGDITFAVAPQFDHIIGVDVGRERIEWAQREFTPIQFRQCSNESTGCESGAFDTVLSVAVINWVANPDRYLAEVYRVLRPDGKLILAAAAPPRLRMMLRRILRHDAVEQPHWCEPLAAFLQRVKKAGFEVEKVDCFYDPFRESTCNLKDILVHTVTLPFRVLSSPGFAPYYGLLARKLPK